MSLLNTLRTITLGMVTSLSIVPSQSQVIVPEPHEVFGGTLSQEADAFLTSCNVALNERQTRLDEKWLQDSDRYDVDLEKGVFWVSKAGRKIAEFDVVVVGSIRTSSQTWEWAWNNPNYRQELAVPRSIFDGIGDKFKLRYLQVGMVPVPSDKFGWYLSGIALQLAGGEGAYKAEGEGYEIYLLLRNPR